MNEHHNSPVMQENSAEFMTVNPHYLLPF